MSARPFRHLCPEADMRDAMSDDEFWAHVEPTWGYDDERPDLDAAIAQDVCGECGSTGACAYDSEGRALIHATTEEDR